MYGRDFKIFKVGPDNKANGDIPVLELEIESVGFIENSHLFEIKLANGLSHEFKCASGDEFNQWKRALSDYRGARSAAVETTTFAGFLGKILCLGFREHGSEGIAQMFGEGGVEEVGGVGEALDGIMSEDLEGEGADGADDLDLLFDLGGGLDSEFLDQ
jgi:hypothetical protein